MASGNFARALVSLLVLGLLGMWLVRQNRAIAGLESESAALRKAVAAAGAGEVRAPVQRITALDRKPVDWRKVAEELRAGVPIGGRLKTNQRLLAAIEAMSVEELMAALDELADAGLRTKDLELLEEQLARVLMVKEPETGLTRFFDRSGWEWTVAPYFTKWLEAEPERALAWLNRMTSDGRKAQGQMISQPFFKVLKSSPAMAGALLAALPENERLESLVSIEVRNLHTEGQEEWARVVRERIPEENRLEAIMWPLMNWSDGDGTPMLLAAAELYMERIEATAAEREACVMQLAKQPRSWRESQRDLRGFDERLEMMREWVAGQAPEWVEPATLKALKAGCGEEGMAKISPSALRLHQATGNDRYLTAVLETANGSHRSAPEVAMMVERLSDEALRAEFSALLQP